MKSIAAAFVLFLLAGAASIGATAAGTASGSASYEKHSVTIEYGWLVRGPDEVEKKTVFRIYFSDKDIGAKIQACNAFSCIDEALDDGGFVEYNGASYVNYWLSLNGGHVQFSGGSDADGAFSFSTKRSDHLAGKVHIDNSADGGGKLNASFDLPLFKTF